MAYTTELGLQMADFYLEEGVDVIVPVDPVVSPDFPNSFKNFVFEPYAKIFRHIRNKGAFSSFFVCGNATHILELMCQTKPDSLAVDEMSTSWRPTSSPTATTSPSAGTSP